MKNIITPLMRFINYICGMPILYFSALVSIVLLIAMRGFVFRYYKQIFKQIFSKKSQCGSEKGISSFSACCTALGNTLGVGNLAGVAIGLALGGPGALFWLWVAGFLGIAIKFSEVTLGSRFRSVDPNTGFYRGGIMWYIEDGIGIRWKWLAVVYAILYILTDLIVPSIQINSIVGVVSTTWGIPPLWIGILSAILISLVLLGGIKRLSEVSMKLIPFAAALYFVVSFVILILHLSKIPQVLKTVFQSAFTNAAPVGGFAGATSIMALRHGIMRGFYSNGAGTGDAAFAHSVASVDHPVQQGMWGAMEVIIDTFICSCTALVILVTDVLKSGLKGTALTVAAFSTFFQNEHLSAIFIGTIVSVFAFTTAVVCAYYGEVCVHYLVKNDTVDKLCTLTLRFVICVFAIVGSVVPLTKLWTINDYGLVVCMVVCLLALLLSRKQVASLTQQYEKMMDASKTSASRDNS